MGTRIVEAHLAKSHDGAAAFYDDGEIICLAAERVDRIKHSLDSNTAYQYIQSRLPLATGRVFDYWSDRHLGTAINHPLGHAASAFYPSPFKSSLVLVVDGQGPYDSDSVASLAVYEGNGTSLNELECFPERGPFCTQSLGHFYSAITYYLGFGFYDQGKTMALAAYGKPTNLIDFLSERCSYTDGRVMIDPDFITTIFQLRYGQEFGWKRALDFESQVDRIERVLGSPRAKSELLCQRHFDIAFAAQSVLENTLLALCKDLRFRFKNENLCLAGGVALNISANSKVLKEAGFQNIYIQPAAGDDGQAIGRLLFRLHNDFNLPRIRFENTYLGPSYSERELEAAAHSAKGQFEVSSVSGATDHFELIAERLILGEVVAFFDGRSEYGPRSLGHRSILADPSNPRMRDHLNMNVKHREWFQPYALSVLSDQVHQLFDSPATSSPYMLLSATARSDALNSMPAGVHVDGSTRIQTVSKENGSFFEVISAFYARTGIPAVLNTSFNDRGEPIVETPSDAVAAFNRMTGISSLAMGRFLIRRK